MFSSTHKTPSTWIHHRECNWLVQDRNKWLPSLCLKHHTIYSTANVSDQRAEPDRDEWLHQRETTALTISWLLLTFIGLPREMERGQRAFNIQRGSREYTENTMKHQCVLNASDRSKKEKKNTRTSEHTKWRIMVKNDWRSSDCLVQLFEFRVWEAFAHSGPGTPRMFYSACDKLIHQSTSA